MRIEMRRATDPTEMDFGKWGCGVCCVPFEVEAVQILVETPDSGPLAATPVCPSCVEYLGRRNPAHYPTIEEYETLNKRYPEPTFDYEPPDEIWHPIYGFTALIDRETLTTRA